MSETEEIEQAPLFDQSDIQDLLLAEDEPCISIHVTTRPESDEKDKNRILYKDRVKDVAAALEQRDMDKHQRRDLIDRLESIGRTEDFWIYQQYGLAVFLSPGRFRVRKLMRSPGDLGVVADSFHLRPLLRATQHCMRYQVLCVDLHDVALYECDRAGISAVPLHSDVPRHIADVLGRPETVISESDGERTGDDDTNLKQYFQGVDQAIRGQNKPTRLPLLLAAQPRYQGMFRKVSRNPNLLDQGLERDPFHELEQSRLGEESWKVVEQALAADVDALVERYGTLEARGEGAASVEVVAQAAAAGQVETLLADEARCIGGRVDPGTGRVDYGELVEPYTDEVIDDIAELVLNAGGRVLFLPSARVPGNTGVAAMLRYPLASPQASG